jgi:hypothetical protein
MISFKEHNTNPLVNLEYHSNNGIPLNENLFRVGSQAYYELFQEARRLMKEGVYTPEGVDKFLLEETDIGEYGLYEDKFVPIDCPLMEAEYKGKEVELNEPKRGGDKKFYVYVKNDKGNVIKIQFGDTTGLKAKINDPEARKSFAARHQCDQKKDKTKAGYWSCRLPYYAKQLGLSGGGNFFW